MKKRIKIYYILFLFFLSFSICQAQEEEFCCERSIAFKSVEMPAEQERDVSGFIESKFFEGLNINNNRFECPIQLIVKNILGIDYAPKNPIWQKDLEYVFFSELLLNKVDLIVSEEFEEGNFGESPRPSEPEGEPNLELGGSPRPSESGEEPNIELGGSPRPSEPEGEPNLELGGSPRPSENEGSETHTVYGPNNAWGDYSINIRLVNVQFNETVWEGHTIWNGNAYGATERLPDETTPNAIKDLGASISPSIDKLIYDYERNPMNCVVKMEQETVSAGEEISISLTNLTDDKGRTPRPWQRLVIRLEQGEITNAVEQGEDKKQWVVLVGEGDVILQYKAPSLCQKEKEILTVFNSCKWGGDGQPLPGTPPKKKLTSKSFDIIPSQPKDCKIEVDHKTEYPPYFRLDIKDIINENGKPLPGNLFIAVKADKGSLKGGEFIDGWHVYHTNEGRVTEKIQYTPPQCAISESDLIEIAQVCESKDGSKSIGSSRFNKKIYNPLCSDATFTLTSRHLLEKSMDKQETIGNDNITKNSEFVEDRSGTITLQLQRHSELNNVILGEYWVNYMSKSRSLDSWHIEYYDHRDEHRESNVNSGGFDQKIREDAEISNVRFRTPDYPIMVTVAYDLETKKAKRVMVQASFDLGYKLHINKTRESESWNKEGSKKSNSNEARDKEDFYSFQVVGDEILDPKLKKKFPSGSLVSGGDGKNILTGYGKTEKNNPISNNAYYDKERDLKTSQWMMTINK